MLNKNIIISILLLVLVFLVNFNIIELLQDNSKERFVQFGNLDDIDGPEGPRGQKGEPGLTGQAGRGGQDGQDGTPGIVQNTDREVIGTPGERGEMGLTGNDGQPGLKGDKGAPGQALSYESITEKNSNIGIGTEEPEAKLDIKNGQLIVSPNDDLFNNYLRPGKNGNEKHPGPSGWGGGICSYDIWAHGSVGAGIHENGGSKALINNKGELCLGNTCLNEEQLKRVISRTNEEMVHERILYGWGGQSEFEFDTSYKKLIGGHYHYGILKYAMPNKKPGVKQRKHRLYAIYSDNMTTSGQVTVRIELLDTSQSGWPAFKDIHFNFGRTWGGKDSNRDEYSQWMNEEEFEGGSHSKIYIKSSGGEGKLKYLTLQTWDYY